MFWAHKVSDSGFWVLRLALGRLGLNEAVGGRARGLMLRVVGLRGSRVHVGSCQNYGPFLGTLNSRCRIILGTQTGTLILTATHVFRGSGVWSSASWVKVVGFRV